MNVLLPPAGPSLYLILNQEVLFHEGQLVLKPLQFDHLSGNILLVLSPHGILQEPGTEGRRQDSSEGTCLAQLTGILP